MKNLLIHSGNLEPLKLDNNDRRFAMISHQPAISSDKKYQVGTNSGVKMDYNTGSSEWVHDTDVNHLYQHRVSVDMSETFINAKKACVALLPQENIMSIIYLLIVLLSTCELESAPTLEEFVMVLLVGLLCSSIDVIVWWFK